MEESDRNHSAVLNNDKKTYHIKMHLNGEDFECYADDLKEGILSLKPTKFKTRAIFSIENRNGEVCNKIAMVRTARMIFSNKNFMSVFINRLVFKSDGQR